MTVSNVGSAFARQLSAQQNTITRCQQVLIESCDTELRVAEQFCKLAEFHIHRNVQHSQELIAAAEKAVAVAAKYARDPEERKRQLAILNDRITKLTVRIKDRR